MTTSNRTDTPPPSNFLRDLVSRDKEAGKHGGRVVTRFPPEPNGYLHIGHSKSICLNFGLSRDFEGVCHLRMDDTNPETEEMEYVEAIQRDIAWLGFDWKGKLFFASDYYPRLYEFAEQLIKEGKAYVCSLNEEEIRKYRGTVTEPGTPSPYRNRSVEENLDLFRRMKKGEFPDGAHVLRAKIDMAHPNMKMRDWPLYRIRHASHYRAGTEWCIYPLYDFAHCLSDLIEGITHSICTLEFESNRELYDWIVEAVGAKDPDNRPHQYEFARLNLTYTMMSKRKLLQLVREKIVSGWDDPRMPTISAMRRRGYTPGSIRELAEKVGVARNNSIVDVALLEHVLRDDLDRLSPRVMAVLRPLRVVIETFEEGVTEELDAPYWPSESGREGSRKVPFSRVIYIEQDDFMENPPKDYFRLAPGREVRLRHAYIIKCERIVKDSEGNVVEVVCSHDPTSRNVGRGDGTSATNAGRRVKGTIHWVSAEHAVDTEVRLYDRLFLTEAPGSAENLHDELNPDSLIVLRGKLEPSLKAAAKGDRVQFERLGFFFADPTDSKDGAPVWNRTVGLKDSWARSQDKAAGKPGASTSGDAPKKEAAKEREPSKETTKKEASADATALSTQWGITEDEATLFLEDVWLNELFRGAIQHGAEPKLVAKWVANEVRALTKDLTTKPHNLTGALISELLSEIKAGVLSPTIAKEVLAECVRSGQSPKQVIESKGLRQIVDVSALDAIATAVIAENADLVARYKAGNANLFGALVGAAMKKTGGKANAKALQEALKKAVGG